MERTQAAVSAGTRSITALGERLIRETNRQGLDRRLILPPAALAVLLLELGRDQHERALTAVSAAPSPATVLEQALECTAEEFGYLTGHLEPLTRLLALENRAGTDRAVAAMAQVLGGAALPDLAESPRIARGAFYTPPALAQVMAAVSGLPRAGESVYDPCSGTGGLALAMLRMMRAAGRAPELVHWRLHDLDALALALAGIQLAAHGMPWVTLTCGNAITEDPS